MKKSASLLSLVISLGLFAVSTVSNNSSAAFASEGHCAQNPYTKVESSPFTATAPEGKVFNSIWIKAGSSANGFGCTEYKSNTTQGCYVISGIGTRTVTASKQGSGSNCKDISHVEFVSTSVNSTPTPTKIPTPTPTGTGGGTPTPTQSNNPTATPTPGGQVLGTNQLPSTGAGFISLISLTGLLSLGIALKKVEKNIVELDK